MTKAPFQIRGADVYTDQHFTGPDDCLAQCMMAIVTASHPLEVKRMKVGKFLIFERQVVALPSPEWDQRLNGVADR